MLLSRLRTDFERRMFLPLLILFAFYSESVITALSVFKSSLTLEEHGQKISGAKLNPHHVAAVEAVSVTFCIRFNLKRFGFSNDQAHKEQSKVITIEDWRTENAVN